VRVLVVPLLLAAACETKGYSPDAPDAARRFVHPLPQCPPDPLFNCTPSVELCTANHRALMTVTDIVNVGTYVEGNATIRTAFPSGDVPPEITFTFQAIDSLVDDWQGWTWTLDPAPMFSSCN
jgi:hypothetical protein